MPRTKKTTRSVKPSRSKPLNTILARISSIAFGHENIVNDDRRLTASTPENKVNIKQAYNKFKCEGIEHRNTFLATLQENINAFKVEFSCFKLSIPASFLNRPLRKFKEYREKFAAEPIEELGADENNSPLANEAFNHPMVPESNVKSVNNRSKNTPKFRTPVNREPYTPNPITPKVNMNEPVSVLRHAQVGEQAVSMSGSPLMVSSVPREDTATVSVPSTNGRVFTIVPNNEFKREQMPPLDEATKLQLQTLYNNLATIFSDD